LLLFTAFVFQMVGCKQLNTSIF